VKLRLLDDTVRFRLTRSEVASLAAGEPVESVTTLGDGRLGYRLEVADALTARLDDGLVVVTVPEDLVGGWSADDGPEGIHGRYGRTSVSVEKDFACLIPRPGVDPDDHYPNPKVPRDRT